MPLVLDTVQRAGLYATLFASVLVQFIGHAFMGTSTSNSIGIITVSVAPVAFAVGWIASRASTAPGCSLRWSCLWPVLAPSRIF